jgi:dolichol-phosphate mannosyltransferase
LPLPFAPSLSIVVPFYNERDNLPRVVGELLAFVRASCARAEIVTVDDGSQDGSAATLPKAPELRRVTHVRNRGLTQALRSGFHAASGDYVTWVPADGQIPIESLARLLDAWRGEDLVLSTYRRRPDGVWRLAMSRGLRLLVRATTGLSDRLEGVYLFRRALLDEMELVARASAGSIGFEIAAKIRALGGSVTSTEIECAPRLSGRSKVANARNIRAYLGELWRIGRSVRRLRRRTGR